MVSFLISGVGVLGTKVGVNVGVGEIIDIGIVILVGTTLVAGTQEAKTTVIINAVTIFLIFIDALLCEKLSNGVRYLRVGGTRRCHFVGTSFEPRELLENAATPTRRVHAVLGNHTERKTHAKTKYHH